MNIKIDFSVEQVRPDETVTPRVLIPTFKAAMEFKVSKASVGNFSALVAGGNVRVDGSTIPKAIIIFVDASCLYPVSVTWAEAPFTTGYDDVVVQPGRFLMVKTDYAAGVNVTLAGVGGTSTGKYILLA